MPLPLEAQAPIEMHDLGWGICCQMRRSTGASLNGTRPAQISTSAWRGEKLMRSMPKRARSKPDAALAMNSMAQHAVPKGIGHSEFARDQLTRKSSRVATQGSLPAFLTTGCGCVTTGPSFHSGFARRARLARSIPLERSLLPDVDEPDEKDEHEDDHLDEAECGELSRRTGVIHHRGGARQLPEVRAPR